MQTQVAMVARQSASFAAPNPDRGIITETEISEAKLGAPGTLYQRTNQPFAHSGTLKDRANSALGVCRVPQVLKMASVSVDEIVDSYWRFLSRNRYDGHLKRFKDRLDSDPKAAEAEAVVFSVLWSEKLRPDVFEDNSTGGPDFRCDPSLGDSFLVEVKSLDSKAVSDRSTLPLQLNGPGGQAVRLITDKLCSAAQSKAAQLGGRGMPGVLAITSAYDYAGLLMDRGPAEYLMTSAPHFRIPLGSTGRSGQWATDLRDAVFCQAGILDAYGDQRFNTRYRSIAAILLVTIGVRETEVVGLLHPDAAHPFDPQLFPAVPYVRFAQWPLTSTNISTEWILGNGQQGSATFGHRRIA